MPFFFFSFEEKGKGFWAWALWVGQGKRTSVSPTLMGVWVGSGTRFKGIIFNNRTVKLFMLLCNMYWFFFFFYNRSGWCWFFFFLYSWKVITVRVPRVKYDSNTQILGLWCASLQRTCVLASGTLTANLVPFLTAQHQLLVNSSHMCGGFWTWTYAH